MRVGIVKQWFMMFMCCLMLVQQQQAFGQAQAVAPVANFVVNRAVAGSLTRVAIARGVAANDPRIAATMVGVSSSMTAVNVVATVGGVALAVAGAPVWLTVAGGLGILAVGAAIVAGTTSLKVDGGVVTVVTGPPTNAPVYTPPSSTLMPSTDADSPRISQYLADGSKLYAFPVNNSDIGMCYSGGPCEALPVFQYHLAGAPVYRMSLCKSGGSYVTCKAGGRGMVIPYFTMEEFGQHYFDGETWSGPGGGGQYLRNRKTFVGTPTLTWNGANGSITGQVLAIQECKEGSPTGANCPGYPSQYTENFFSSNEAQNLVFYKPASSTQTFDSLDAIVAGLDATQKGAKLSADALANVVNQAWQNAAAQPGYTGLPYSATSPVTPAEVQAWQFENPALNPTIGDLLVPAVAPGTGAIPISVDAGGSTNTNPNPDPNPTPTPTPVGTTNVNVVNVPTVRVEWGADPGVVAPSLETTPTASAILSPLLNLMPSLRSFVVPSHSSICPTASFGMFEKQLVMAAHCTVLDESKPVLYAVMAFVWLMLAAFIILRA
jgi:hypothetical protein